MGLSDVLRDAGLSGYAEAALVLFVLAFALIVWRVFRRRRPRDWERAPQLPLEDDVVLMPRDRDGRGDRGQGGGGREETRAGQVGPGRRESH